MTPFVLVIFGATGDLTKRKLLPALFSLFKQGKLGERFYIVGFARKPFTDEAYSHMLGDELEFHQDPQWEAFSTMIYYQQGLFDEKAGYEALITKLNGFDTEIGSCITRLFYLATQPINYEHILHNLSETKLSEGCGPAVAKAMAGEQGGDVSKWTRLAIEKPFGRDLETARELDRKLGEVFDEKQIFRVDHYLGKETVQNMIAFRFANSIFEPVWNKEHIDHVQITFAEKRGITGRGAFFDGVGQMRDVMQNHLLQIMATVTMEQPMSFTKEGVRDARAKAIQSIRCIAPEDVPHVVARGQYDGYLQENEVAPDSLTETFAAMKLLSDTDRFADVPFYLRAGKSLAEDRVEIKIIFKQMCQLLFKEYGCPEIGNILTIRIQPNEGIGMQFIAKKPGARLDLGTVSMDFSYAEHFTERAIDAYEKLLLDILAGDQMLFNRSDELESSWQLISNILTGWEQQKLSGLPQYAKGSWGPQDAFSLIEKDGRKWL